jgi:hypothetical protein
MVPATWVIQKLAWLVLWRQISIPAHPPSAPTRVWLAGEGEAVRRVARR